ncbi:tetratricopeptide repeat protein [Actinosynnema sp. NPDC047251]|uniref:CHAT domain-containing protein n=1 Tax=Saccharothrix espanaensis (strain ATCC 51144 / DSM 44229 / JCM 9112 / NBRC 15066 / NRRL 15764) TaxID=1179773 RepID=K0JW32_SACES|nr:tetratricopeptide repeat protein [Saccharothrix espanaensis]CCH30226.1 hypothetical protein BN6_29160 [Saccharothrix espanaensis DSM 44229]
MPILRLADDLDPTSTAGAVRWTLHSDTGADLGSHVCAVDDGVRGVERALALFEGTAGTPDGRSEVPANTIATTGRWVRDAVLGPLAGVLRNSGEPVVVELPVRHSALAALPLELALAGDDGVPPPVVFRLLPENERVPPAEAGSGALRVLAVLCAPPGSPGLGTWRERRMLTELAHRHGSGVELTVLQYGVTVESLTACAADDRGWDVIHFGGHGDSGHLAFDDRAGGVRNVTSTELATAFAPLRGRVGLVVAAACHSAAEALAGLRLSFGMAAERASTSRYRAEDGSVASVLATALDTTVIAFRHPLDDAYAIEFCGQFYRQAVDHGTDFAAAARAAFVAARPLLRHPALGMPVTMSSSSAPQRLRPLTAGAPATGPLAAGTVFAGRAGVLTEAARLVTGPVPSPVLTLAGPPGVGTSACAGELVTARADRFDHVIRHVVRREGHDGESAFAALVVAFDDAVDGAELGRLFGGPDGSRAAFTWLADIAARRRLLLVLDDVDPLLDADGRWNDPRWRAFVSAITGQSGHGRVVLTARQPVHEHDAHTIPVPLLTQDEALLLLRELPHFGTLLRRTAAEDRKSITDLLRRILVLAEGRPYPLLLAEAAAGSVHSLAAFVHGARPGDTGLATDTAMWVDRVFAGLPEHQQALLVVIHNLAEYDRNDEVAGAVLDVVDHLAAHLDEEQGSASEKPALAVNPVDVRPAAAELVRAGLLQEIGTAPKQYRLPIAVAGVCDAVAGESARDQVRVAAVLWWRGVLRSAVTRDHRVLDANRQAQALVAMVPYLADSDIDSALRAAEHGITLAPAYRTAARLHEPVEALNAGPGANTTANIVLARLFMHLAPDHAADRLRELYFRFTAAREPRAALVAGFHLIELTRRRGRWTAELVELADSLPELSDEAGLGPWSAVSQRARRAEVWFETGRRAEAARELEAVERLLPNLPAFTGRNESTTPDSVRVGVTQLRRNIEFRSSEWERALESNAALLAGQLALKADLTTLAKTKFNDHEPLRRLSRLPEAEVLLLRCARTFRQAGETTMLAAVYGALGDVARDRGDPRAALLHLRDALRYAYRVGDLELIVITHVKLGHIYLVPENNSPLHAHAHLIAGVALSEAASRDHRDPLRTDAEALHGLPAGGIPEPGAVARLIDAPRRDVTRVWQRAGVTADHLTAATGHTVTADWAAADIAKMTTLLEEATGLTDPLKDEQRRHEAEDDIGTAGDRGSPPKEELCGWCERPVAGKHEEGCIAVPRGGAR